MLKRLIKNRPFQNFFFISLYQGVNFIALIVFIPFLTKTIGVEKFGLVTVMQAICSFFYVLVDYGFSVTTVRKISVHRNDPEKLESIIKNTIGVKLLLLIIAFPLFLIIPVFFLKVQYNLNFVLLSFVAVIGQAAFPTWLCQGLEENKIAFYANLLSKFLLCLFIYLFIKNHEHYSYYLFFMGGANFITGILLTLYIIRYILKFHLKFKLDLNEIIIELNEGKEVFFSNLSISTYLSSNVLILSLFVSPYTIGLYGIAEKIMMLLRTLLSVFVMAIYPFVCKLVYEKTFNKVFHQVLNITIPFNLTIFFLCGLMAYFNTFIASFFSYKDIIELSIILRKVSFLPFLVSLNTIPNLIILAYNKEKVKSYILLFSTVMSFILSFILVPYFNINGTIGVMYIVELFVALASIYYLLKIKRENNS
jgi:polysaccharide transporter, PST family